MGKNDTKTKTIKSGRVFNIVQYEINPVTNQSLNFDESNIISCVRHQSISRYAYIKHDKDHYSEIDCEEFKEKYNITKTINDVKPPHWHIVLEVPNKCKVSLIAKWLNVPENQIEVPNQKGRTPITTRGMEKVFLECVGYLTHSDIRQQTLDKYTYDSSEVKANFDWETLVTEAQIFRTKYGRELTLKEWYRNEVLTNGLRPKDIDTTAYTNDFDMLNKLRKRYLSDYAPMPPIRLNYYIYSDEGRVGKGLLSKALARALYPDFINDDDVYFNVGGKNVGFDGYDGQPVIIWNDVRPSQLLELFGDRGNLLDTLDMYPSRKSENIKYGKVSLINMVNIFNSVIPYDEFFEDLVKEYKNSRGEIIRSESKQREQIYGRFPMIIPIDRDSFSILLNKGVMGEGAFTEYYTHNRYISHLKEIHQLLTGRDELVKQLDNKITAPIVEVHNNLKTSAISVDKNNSIINMSDEDILDLYSDCGTCFIIDDDNSDNSNDDNLQNDKSNVSVDE